LAALYREGGLSHNAIEALGTSSSVGFFNGLLGWVALVFTHASCGWFTPSA